MGSFILYAQEAHGTTSFSTSVVPAPDVEAALQQIPPRVQTWMNTSYPGNSGGGWVGSARITRQAVLSLTGNNRFTRVAWLYQYPDPAGLTVDQLTRLNADVRALVVQLAGVYLPNIQNTNWTVIQALDYNPVTNGPVAWWQAGLSNGAAATATRDTWDLNQQLGSSSTVENPTGPAHAVPPNFDPITGAFRGPNSPTSQLTDLLKTVGYIAAGGIALYLLWPVIYGARSTASSVPRLRTARANPSRNAKCEECEAARKAGRRVDIRACRGWCRCHACVKAEREWENAEAEDMERRAYGECENPHFPGRIGSGTRFQSCVEKVTASYARKGEPVDAQAVCASIGRRAVGPKKMAKLAAAGRRRRR